MAGDRELEKPAGIRQEEKGELEFQPKEHTCKGRDDRTQCSRGQRAVCSG